MSNNDNTTTGEADDQGSDVEPLAITSNYKILGEFSAGNGVGVLGQNNASSGTPIGVQGAVPNASGGYGLATPDDASVGGTAELNAVGGSVTGNQTVSNLLGNGLTVNSGALRAAVGNALGFDGSNQIAVTTDSVTVAGNSVSLGDSTSVAYADLSDGSSFPIPNSDLANSSVTVSAGSGLQNGGSVSLGGSTTLNVGSGRYIATSSGQVDFNGPAEWQNVGDTTNTASRSNAVVAGGTGNTASGFTATVGGGDGNEASGTFATVAGGQDNTASGQLSAIAGGGGFDAGNTVSGELSFVGSGEYNVVKGDYAVIAGGGPDTPTVNPQTNSNTVYDNYGVIGGGGNNQAGSDDGNSQDTTNATFATVAGGQSNTASGEGATVPGGQRGAAEDDKSFVWNDTTGYHAIPNTSSDGLSSNEAVDGEPVTGANTFSVSATGGVRFITGSASNPNVTYIPNDSASWTTTSSRAVKTNIDPVDPEEALSGVEQMEVATWEYEDEDGAGTGTTHIGPMAEEFHDAFDVGSSDEHINSINADGAAFAAIQGLADRLERKTERIDELEAEVERKDQEVEELRTSQEELREENEQLRARLEAIEDRLDRDAPAET